MPKLLPVIHVTSEEQALENAWLCADAGIEGVFLINHKKNHNHLFRTAEAVHRVLPSLWLGLNALDLSPEQVMNKAPEFIRGIWCDNPGLIEDSVGQMEGDIINKLRVKFTYFGGVAFKYQEPVLNLAGMSRLAAGYMDVITTSGEGTGIAADVAKIKTIKAAVGGTPLALASGVTAENVESYLPYVEYFLVATGISKSFDYLCPEKLSELQSIISGWKAV